MILVPPWPIKNKKLVTQFLSCFAFMFRGLSLLIVGGGPEDFWGATKFFSEILGGHQIFSRNFGGLSNYFPKFWGATKFFLSMYEKNSNPFLRL